ncbi:Omp85 family outer membrane protein [Algoriphagus sp.]|uniref:Omp85 family outer membrane protein n=1 Tax=Algoriphagus sp. TaxID=1872435 RepID=UPI00391CBD10
MKKLITILLGGVLSLNAYAQTNDTTQVRNELPFFIHESKKIPDFELEEKKEGTFVTGLPRFEFDPIRGFGVGGNVNLFLNKTKEDPFFDYTAYRHRVNAEFFIFQNGRIRYSLNYDAPYIFNSKWRLRVDMVHWEDPNAQYWGIGRSSLNPLRFKDKRSGITRNFNKVADYEENLGLAELGNDGNYYTDFHFNHIHQREQLYNVLGERVLMGGKLRLMFGYEALLTSFSSYNGKRAEEAFTINGEAVDAISNPTLIDIQKAAGVWDRFNLSGFSEDYQFTSMLAGAIIYDTRDFEPDPSNGVFLQYSHEYSAPWLGSKFNFNKFMIQGQFIHTLKRWRDNKGRLTFAGLVAMGHIFGPNINFIEMWDLSSQAEAGGILVLGGGRSIRGFREARFLAPTVALVNLEMRARLVDFRFLNQHFSLGATPFYDFGSVWDRPGDMNFKEWRGAPGIGGRIAWNQSTILRLDYAQSREGGQFFFGFGHIF